MCSSTYNYWVDVLDDVHSYDGSQLSSEFDVPVIFDRKALTFNATVLVKRDEYLLFRKKLPKTSMDGMYKLPWMQPF